MNEEMNDKMPDEFRFDFFLEENFMRNEIANMCIKNERESIDLLTQYTC